MDTLEAIEEKLPWGLHDALLVQLGVDWAHGTAKMDLRIAMSEAQDQDRMGQLLFTDLLFCAVEAPELDKARGYGARSTDGVQVDCGAGVGHESCRDRLPSIPAGFLLYWFYVREWNRFIHICARAVQFAWLEDTIATRTVGRRVLFVGEEIRDLDEAYGTLTRGPFTERRGGCTILRV